MKELTKEQRIARHKDFLQANWPLIAAFSWENYLVKGRGAVLVPEADFVDAELPQLKALRFHYLPLAERHSPPFEEVLAGKEAAWLEAYDPDEKAVVCILREAEGVSSYFIGGRMKPSEAYAREKARLS